jgi:hypothetical protein
MDSADVFMYFDKQMICLFIGKIQRSTGIGQRFIPIFFQEKYAGDKEKRSRLFPVGSLRQADKRTRKANKLFNRIIFPASRAPVNRIDFSASGLLLMFCVSILSIIISERFPNVHKRFGLIFSDLPKENIGGKCCSPEEDLRT